MNLSEMRTIVRRDLHDENAGSYRWSDVELDRHIGHAVKDFSEALPLAEKATVATTAGAREISLSSLSDLVMVEAVEYPTGKFPQRFQRFSLWGTTLVLLGDEVPDGGNAYIYYGKLHTLSTQTSTIPSSYEDLIACGAVGYGALEWAAFAINQVNVGGNLSQGQFLAFGKEKLAEFRSELRRLGRRNRIRIRQLYQPYYLPVAKTSDSGP